jgi:hypothetical protein
MMMMMMMMAIAYHVLVLTASVNRKRAPDMRSLNIA